MGAAAKMIRSQVPAGRRNTPAKSLGGQSLQEAVNRGVSLGRTGRCRIVPNILFKSDIASMLRLFFVAL